MPSFDFCICASRWLSTWFSCMKFRLCFSTSIILAFAMFSICCRWTAASASICSRSLLFSCSCFACSISIKLPNKKKFRSDSYRRVMMTNNMASTLIHLRDKIFKFQGISNISCFFLEAFQFQSSEVLCVYNFTFRIIVRPLRVPKNS